MILNVFLGKLNLHSERVKFTFQNSI